MGRKPMRQRKHYGWKTLTALLLCTALLAGMPLWAAADEADVAASNSTLEITDEYAAEVEQMRGVGFLNESEMTKMVDDFVAERGIDPKNFAVGFCYTATGDEFYYNGDTWFYPGSVYKVPLMMLMAEKVSSGQLEPDSEIMGMKLSQIEEYILTYSNNDWAHNIRRYLHDGAGDAVWRESAKAYADMPDADFNPDYLDYGYQSARYITRTLETLYFGGEERFPSIIPCLLKANPVNYFRLSSEMQKYDIAQKYGSYVDNSNRNWNCTVGIIYRDNPIILSVMTLNIPNYEKNISDTAVMFNDYAAKLDAKLDDYLAEQAAEAEAEAEAAAQAEAEAQAETQGQTAEGGSAPTAAPAAPADAPAGQQKTLLMAGIIAVLAVAVIAALAVIAAKEKKRRRYESFRRRFEEEMRFEEEEERRRSGEHGSHRAEEPGRRRGEHSIHRIDR